MPCGRKGKNRAGHGVLAEEGGTDIESLAAMDLEAQRTTAQW